MKYNYNENSLFNAMDSVTGTIIGRNPAGVFIQIDKSLQFGFAYNYHALRNGTRVLGSVKYQPQDDCCVQMTIDSILEYADAA